MLSVNAKISRYCLDFNGIELDLSIKSAPEDMPLAAVAQKRAADSDVDLSAVAIDPFYCAWAN